MTGVSPGRRVAALVLERVTAECAFADLALDAELSRARLADRDASLATELVYGTLRWQRYLDWLVAPHSRRPIADLDVRVLVLLRLTAYQMVFLTRVPAFAAVNDAVTLAHAPRGHSPHAYVNAVLRSLVRSGSRTPPPPADPVEAVAVRCSFPTWLAQRWLDRYGEAVAGELMLAMNARPPLSIRTNTLRTTREALAERLRREEGIEVTVAKYAPEGLVADGGGTPGRWRAFDEGQCVVQDEASMLVAHLVAAAPGETIGDVCAAPGTKSTHLAQLMGNRGSILAFDPQPARLDRVRESAERLGITIIEAHAAAAETIPPGFRGRCDRVLVDAPCSNLGVLRRNPEVKWRRGPDDVREAASRQRRILEGAAGMVAPGGSLVYATCSLEPEENAEVVREFIAGHPAFAVDAPFPFPIAPDRDGFLRCRPDLHGTDGFTAVRLRYGV